ncbi:MAG TPA: hypothetical protein PKD53_02370 [Chloroflexaceae bacterium]|nr:hypothetical protein [Chloroflexaceae bacterium]
MLRLVILRLTEAFFRRRWSYILTMLLPLLLAIPVYIFVPPNYRVRGTVYVQSESLLTALSTETNTPSWVNFAQQTLSEAQSLLYTESFAVGVIDKTAWRDSLYVGPKEREQILEDYRKAVSVSAEGNNIVVFSAQDPDPVVAVQLATETMNAYVAWRTSFIRTDSEIAQNFFTDLVARYEDDLALAEQDLRDYLLLYPDPVRGSRSSEEQFEIDRLTSAVSDAAARVRDAREKEENARLAFTRATTGSLQEYLVIDAPSVPTDPPSRLMRIALIFGGGLVLGLLLTMARLAFAITVDRSLYFPLDVLHGLKQSTLALLPLEGARGKGKAGSRKAAPSEDPNAQPSPGQVSPAKG